MDLKSWKTDEMKEKMGFKSIKAQLNFWFLLLALFPLLVFCTIFYFHRIQAIKERETNNLITVRDLKVDQINKWLDERIGDVHTLTGYHRMRGLERAFTEKERTPEDTHRFLLAQSLLKGYIENYHDYSEIFIINAGTGTIEISSNKDHVGEIRYAEEYFTAPLRTRKLYITDIHLSERLQKPVMYFSKPILCLEHNGKHIMGILAARIDPAVLLYELLSDRTGLGETGETLIVNQDALALNQLRWFDDAPFRLKITAEPARRAARGETGALEIKDYRGVKVLAAYTYIPGTQWGFVAKQDKSEIFAPIAIMLRNILIIVFVLLFAVYAVARRLSRGISKPIIDMTEVFKRIQAGDLSARNRLQSRNEIGFLAESFNSLADSVLGQMSIQQKNAHITETMVSTAGLKDFAARLISTLVKVTESSLGAVFLLDENDRKFKHLASTGINHALLGPFEREKLEGQFGEALARKEISLIKNIPKDTIFQLKTFAGLAVPREIITLPIVVNKKVITVICLAALKPYTKESLEVLNQTWVAMSTSFSNLLANEKSKRLSEELRSKNIELQSKAEELRLQSEKLQKQNVELEARRIQVEEANRLKSEFMSNISHELRTPLNSIMALSRVLLMQARDKLSTEETDYLAIVERNGKQLLELIDGILDLSKIEAERMDLNLKKFSLRSTIRTIIENLKPIAEEKGIEIYQRIAEDLPDIKSDEVHVDKIIKNIVANALKFTEQGNVTVSASSDAEKVCIEVSDTGIGIPERELPNIFEAFRQVDGASSRQYGGTGLGLAIASKASKILGGEISVESTPGKGSIFTLSLPRG